NYPVGMAYDTASGRLFVADSSNNRIKVYDFAGAPPANGQIVGVYASSFTVTFSSVTGSLGYTLDASTASDYTGTVTSSITYDTTLSTLTFPSSLLPNTTYFLRLGAFYSGTTVYTYVTTIGTSTLTNLVTGAQVFSTKANAITVNWASLAGNGGSAGYRLDA